MDSLRYWVTEMHVDGFRFDLAATLAREFYDVDRLSTFFELVQQDPVVSQVKLIAEPWDVGPGRLPGRQLPAAVDGVERQVPRHGPRLLARRARHAGRVRLPAHRLGDLYEDSGRRPFASHQLRHRPRRLHPARPRLLQREAQRGQRRGQQRRREPQPVVELRRRGPDRRPRDPRRCGPGSSATSSPPCCCPRACRCCCTATSWAAPRSGNNNAYCPGHRAAWMDWDARRRRRWSSSPRQVAALRREHPTFRRRRFFTGRRSPRAARARGSPDIVWLTPTGEEMTEQDWDGGFGRHRACSSTATASPSRDQRGERITDDFPALLQRARRAIEFTLPADGVRRGVGGRHRHRRPATALTRHWPERARSATPRCRRARRRAGAGRSVVRAAADRSRGRDRRRDVARSASTYRVRSAPASTSTRRRRARCDYLDDLGVSRSTSRRCSTAEPARDHGYDVVDHTPGRPGAGRRGGPARLSPRPRARRARRRWSTSCPTTSASPTPAPNPWWWDVLARARRRRTPRAFDIDWDRGGGRMLSRCSATTTRRADEPSRVGATASCATTSTASRSRRAPARRDAAGGARPAALRAGHWRRGRRGAELPPVLRRHHAGRAAGRGPGVFDATHAEIAALGAPTGEVDGLRVDHPDGLRDPAATCAGLRAATGPDAWLVVEKILEPGEQLPAAGRSTAPPGYDALARDRRRARRPGRRGAARPRSTAELTGDGRPTASAVEHTARKRRWPTTILRGRGAPARRAASRGRAGRPTPAPRRGAGRAARRLPGLPHLPARRGASTWTRRVGRGRARAGPDLPTRSTRSAPLLRRPGRRAGHAAFQQTSGTVMAKGVEDTAFYRYTRLVALNEVGGDPGQFGVPPAEFHAQRQAGSARGRDAMTTLRPTTPSAARTSGPGSPCWPSCPASGRAVPRGWSRPRTRCRTASLEYLLWQSRRRRLADRRASGCTPTPRRRRGRPSSSPAWTSTRTRASRRRCTPWSTRCYDDAACIAEVERVRRRDRRRRGWSQLARQKLLQLDHAGRAGRLPGHRAVGPLAGRPGQPPPGRLRRCAGSCSPHRRGRLPVPAGRTSTGAAKLLVTAQALRLRRRPAGAVRRLPRRAGRRRRPPSTRRLRPGRRARPWRPGCRSGWQARRLARHRAGPAGRRVDATCSPARTPAARGRLAEVCWRATRSRCWSDPLSDGPSLTRADRGGHRATPRSPRHGTASRGRRHERRAWTRVDAVDAVDGTSLDGAARLTATTAAGGAPTCPTPGPAPTTRFLLDDDETPLPDPRSRWQPAGVHGLSRVYDHAAFAWTDHDWTGRQLPGSVHLRAARRHVHPRRHLRRGDRPLDHLVDLGSTSSSCCRSTPSTATATGATTASAGTPSTSPTAARTAFKRFVDACHAARPRRGPRRRLQPPRARRAPTCRPVRAVPRPAATPGAPRSTSTAPHSDEVRRYIIDNALMWLRDYHVDGLRLDAVHALVDRRAVHLLEQLAVEVEALATHAGPAAVADRRVRPQRPAAGHPARGGRLRPARAVERRLPPRAARRCSPASGRATTPTSVADCRARQGADPGVLPRRHLVAASAAATTAARSTRAGSRATGSSPTCRTTTRSATGPPATGSPRRSRRGCRVRRGAAAQPRRSRPMLFMGEEWAARTPWQFFTHPRDRARDAVARAGARSSPRTAGPAEDVPDPQDARPSSTPSSTGPSPPRSRTRAAHHAPRADRAAQARPELSDPWLDEVDVDVDEDARTSCCTAAACGWRSTSGTTR